MERQGAGLTRVSAVIENVGYLPTYVLASSRSLTDNEPLRAELVLREGVELCAGERQRRIGHLDGWGSYEGASTPALAHSQGDAVRRRVDWVVRGAGRLVVRAGGARVGFVEASVEISPS